jgi:hypothetical protein
MAAGWGCGVDGIEVLGVIGAAEGPVVKLGAKSANSDTVVMTEPVSDVVDALRTILGRLPDGMEGVRECRISMRVARDTGWTSGTPLRKANVLTWTDLLGVSQPEQTN